MTTLRRSSRRHRRSWIDMVVRERWHGHVGGGLIAIALLSAIALVMASPRVSRSVARVRQAERDQKTIALRQAWQTRFQEASETNTQIQNELNQLAAWLPKERSWEQIERQLNALADQAGLQVQSINRLPDAVGTRVGVRQAVVKLVGEYPSMLQFTASCGTDSNSIWCNAIVIERLEDNAQAHVNLETGDAETSEQIHSRVVARVSLRLPFAAAGSLAGQLNIKPVAPTDVSLAAS